MDRGELAFEASTELRREPSVAALEAQPLVPEEGEEYPNRHWLWSDKARETNGYAQVHAFDIEAEVALGIYVSSGFSPGETVDFILGFFGIDIAKDDTRLDPK